jgi:hypothetical protein
MFSTCNCCEHSLLKNKTSTLILGVDGIGKKCSFVQVVGFMKLMVFLDVFNSEHYVDDTVLL